jgi:hypothetical protein
MLVKWNGDGLLSVAPIDPAMSDAAKANLIKAFILFPGWNEVPDAEWNLCKFHLVDAIEKGKVEEYAAKEKNDKGMDIYVGIPIETVATKTPKKAIEIISECCNPTLLERWNTDVISTNNFVNIALAKQIRKCNEGVDE